MQQPKPTSEDYSEIVRSINKGEYQIPKFQRDFVWGIDRTAELIDSLIKGFPIGSFILWETSERLKSVKKLGGVDLIEPEDNKDVYYVLDGQQRLTSLYLALEGIKIGKTDYKKIYIDLDKNPETDDKICVLEKTENSISFHRLMSEDPTSFLDEMEQELIKKMAKIRNTIELYRFSIIKIKDQPLEKIAEVFTRINTGGKELKLFEIVNAKIYTEEKRDENNDIITEAFDLEEKFNKFIEELKGSSYQTIGKSKPIVLQLISLILEKSAKREHILKIDKEEFIAEWDNTIKSVKKAIDKIVGAFNAPVSKLLPYPSLIIPMAYFYRINNFTDPTPSQLKQIKNHFFRTAITNRFSATTEAKLGSDMKLMTSIKNNENIKSELEKEIPIDSFTKEYFIAMLKKDFSPANAIDKAVLCIMASKTPKRFNDNSKVRLDNSWLSVSASKNYHHFFPKAFLKREENDEYANALANITFVDDYLNKNVIKDKAPSVYIDKFANENPDGIREALESHFIGYEDFGVFEDDYDTFLDKRATLLAQEIMKIITDFGE